MPMTHPTDPSVIGMRLTEAPEWSDYDERHEREYMDRARRVPEIKRWRESRLLGLSFHLWCMTREELAEQTVDGLRERKKMLDGYITDAEIAAVLDAEKGRVFHAQPDSKAWRIGVNGRWVDETATGLAVRDYLLSQQGEKP